MNRDAHTTSAMDLQPVTGLSNNEPGHLPADLSLAPRMRYRSRPVSVAVDSVSLVISECISITSAFQKHARSPHSAVSAILGGSPNPVHLGPPGPALRGGIKSPAADSAGDVLPDVGLANRWGLRGKRGKSIQDNPLMAGFGKLRHELAGIKGYFILPRHLLWGC
jgi:golgi-specific brefeldin A-resistance guanine nucleotide exchange factor 1